jgi:type 1 glutamine amidotransferase
MNHNLARASKRALSLVSMLGVVAASTIAFSWLASGPQAQAQAPAAAPAAGGLVNPPGASIARPPLQLDPSTWEPCKHITNGPENVYGLRSGMLCPPSISTGTPAIQAQLLAEQAAYRAANPAAAGGRGGGRGPAAPMVCNPALTPAAAPGAAPGRGAAALPQGGRGKIRVLVVVKGHPYEHELFDSFLDCLGNDITWTKADHPAADLLMNPAAGKNFDVYLFYDLGGPGERQTNTDGTPAGSFYPDPTPALKKGFEALLKAGKGMVFLHHASAAWPHVWPEYSEVIGGACDWFDRVTVRGILDPHHGFYGGTAQHLTVVDKSSPITQGLGDGFDITDEAYACAWFPESVHPLLTTSFAPPDPLVNLNPKRQYSNLNAWYKASENSPVFYVQSGHDHLAWENPGYQLLVDNAIKWAASKEALAWAKAHHTTIFHDGAAKSSATKKAPAKKAT